MVIVNCCGVQICTIIVMYIYIYTTRVVLVYKDRRRYMAGRNRVVSRVQWSHSYRKDFGIARVGYTAAHFRLFIFHTNHSSYIIIS